jgi:hypothetical protein
LDDANRFSFFLFKAQITPFILREEDEFSCPSFAVKLGPVFLLYSPLSLPLLVLFLLLYLPSLQNLRQSPNASRLSILILCPLSFP